MTLEGTYVRLIPLERGHAPELLRASQHPEVQRYLGRPVGSSLAEVRETVDYLLGCQAAGTDLPFATVLRSSGELVGQTRFLRLEPENDKVEIGGTFLDRAYWRTPLNSDAKLAMLRYAFEEGGAHRVVLQTDLRNVRSQAAIERLGAVREGVLREDRHLPGGLYRSSVIFSILSSEWPGVRSRLERALARPWTPNGPEQGRPSDGSGPG